MSGCCQIAKVECASFTYKALYLNKNLFDFQNIYEVWNHKFLAQKVYKWCLKKDNSGNVCCDTFAFLTLFANVQYITTSYQSIFNKHVRSGKIFSSA